MSNRAGPLSTILNKVTTHYKLIPFNAPPIKGSFLYMQRKISYFSEKTDYTNMPQSKFTLFLPYLRMLTLLL